MRSAKQHSEKSVASHRGGGGGGGISSTRKQAAGEEGGGPLDSPLWTLRMSSGACSQVVAGQDVSLPAPRRARVAARPAALWGEAHCPLVFPL